MKKLLQINSVVNYASTGRIAEEIGQVAIQNGWESYIAFGRDERPSKSKLIRIGSDWGRRLHALQTRLFDNHGFASFRATQRFIHQIELINPDIIHLHNLHGYYIHIGLLFEYLKVANKPIVWTLYDCWALTGHCTYFDSVGCSRWETGCYSCPQITSYPASWFIDRSSKNYEIKKRLFNLPKNMTIVVHSDWLLDKVKKSYLKSLPVKLINNGVNICRFNPKNTTSLKARLKINDKFVILGVAYIWGKRKGFEDFLKLSDYLNEDEIIVLDGVDEKYQAKLPPNIVIHKKARTVEELAELYSLADVFVNPTYEDNFPTTNLEAMACGTPVITYNTGGSPEAVDFNTGIVVGKGDVEELAKSISVIKKAGKHKYSECCLERIKEKFNGSERYKDYVTLFETLIKQNR